MPRPTRGLGRTLLLFKAGVGKALAIEVRVGNKDVVSAEDEGGIASPYGKEDDAYLGGRSCSNPKFERVG